MFLIWMLACSQDEAELQRKAPSGPTFCGQPLPLETRVVVDGADRALVDGPESEDASVLEDGDGLPIVVPPQGGYVAWVGIDVRLPDLWDRLDQAAFSVHDRQGWSPRPAPDFYERNDCLAELSAALIDPTSGQLRLDARLLAGISTEEEGWVRFGWAPIPVCPNEWASIDVVGGAFDLEIAVTELFSGSPGRRGETVRATIEVLPYCDDTHPETVPQCECVCRHDYVLGERCS